MPAWYYIGWAFVILGLAIIFGGGVFYRLELPKGEEGDWGLNEPQPHDSSLSSDCVWYINSYIGGLDKEPEDVSGVGAAVYEALSAWIASKYEEEAEA